jgi:hypothetical protein
MLCRTLESAEAEAVRGDLAESGATGGQAMLEVLGLVIRRQAALWMHWRPWLALLGLMVPLGMLLSVASRRMADGSAVYIWLYANNWNWAYLRNPGFRQDFVHYVGSILLEYLTLACWAWTAGLLVGSASRAVIQVNRVLLCLVLSFGALLGAPLYFAYYQQHVLRALGIRLPPDPNGAVFALAFYRDLLPLIVQAVVVVVPTLWAMGYGARLGKFRPAIRTVLWTAAIATLATAVLQNPVLWLFHNPRRPPRFWQTLIEPGEGLGLQVWLLHLVVYWPVAYLAASTIARRLRRRTAGV